MLGRTGRRGQIGPSLAVVMAIGVLAPACASTGGGETGSVGDTSSATNEAGATIPTVGDRAGRSGTTIGPSSVVEPPVLDAGRPEPVVATHDADGVPIPIDHGPRSSRRVAITFDSNMTDDMLARLDRGEIGSYDNTDAVAEILERFEVPTTFFLAGKWVQRYPESTRRLATNPRFEIGSHSWSHLAFASPCHGLPPLARDEMAHDVRTSFEVIEELGVRTVPYFRFPGLCEDAAALGAIAPTGVTVIGGDVASGDAFGTSARAIVDDVLGLTEGGSIIVMHITKANAPFTAEALPAIIEGLRDRGYELSTVSDLLAG